MHTIRLRYPWLKQTLDKPVADKPVDGQSADQQSATELRVDVPESCEANLVDGESASLQQNSDQDDVRYTRRFNRPTGLDSHSTVRLQIKGWRGNLVALRINNHAVLATSESPIELDITQWLAPHNRIEIHLSASVNESPCLSGEVLLEIDSQ